MIRNAIEQFARKHFMHQYFPVPHDETDKIQPLALLVHQHRPVWKRPFARSEIVVHAGFGRYVKDGAQQTVCESITTNIRDREFSMKQKVDVRARNDEVEVGVKLPDNQGVLTLGKLSEKYVDNADIREILANAELDANKMEAFGEPHQLLLITSVIYSEKFELKGKRMPSQTEVAAEVKSLPPHLQFLNLHRNSPLRIHVRDTYFPPHAAARNSQAPILIKCLRVDYYKETNRLEICEREAYVRYAGRGGPIYFEKEYYVISRVKDDEYDDVMIETTDQTDPPAGCLIAKDVETLENIYRVVLLSEKTTAQRKARVSKYRQWFEEVLMTGQETLMLDKGMTLEDCDFLTSVYLPCAEDLELLDLTSLPTEVTQDFAIAFKVLDDLSDEQWKGLELSLAADPEH